ncbi:hypothetical protein Ae201684P_011959 [Aphanomyces euteiches]|uniref:Reverse transcriptase domain-containing protein n=1 Tax=Aphanomyces euteiches TaxID=100861 RepID=A0A6G0W667_9STRA|nr:hypothetical protein Ae201684_018348 [Aphanomyces euteiches]KAH9083155.1 hypothetical protein Ae201684P_014052 [Aphanomyces euteiches]KAH9087832.1 hypothetical protein Ae201684P_011959 [Aphanomyces euteiches]
MYTSARAEYSQATLDSGFDRHANYNESHFLRKPPAIKILITTAVRNRAVTTNPEEVASIFTAHWRSIMIAPTDTPLPDAAQVSQVINHVDSELSPEQRNDLDRPTATSELRDAIKSVRKNKSPGPDGWPAVFFQTAPETFAAILSIVFEYQRKQHGCLLTHQHKSSITLLYKKGDRTDPGNYHPIALMPVEVKILSRVLAYRLSAVAATLIHPSQAGFVIGRSMADHIHLIDALQHKATRDNEEWYATFLDFAKAYDMVRWSFLFEVMEKMNIGPDFLSWVHLLYKNPKPISSSMAPSAQRLNQHGESNKAAHCHVYYLTFTWSPSEQCSVHTRKPASN